MSTPPPRPKGWRSMTRIAIPERPAAGVFTRASPSPGERSASAVRSSDTPGGLRLGPRVFAYPPPPLSIQPLRIPAVIRHVPRDHHRPSHDSRLAFFAWVDHLLQAERRNISLRIHSAQHEIKAEPPIHIGIRPFFISRVQRVVERVNGVLAACAARSTCGSAGQTRRSPSRHHHPDLRQAPHRRRPGRLPRHADLKSTDQPRHLPPRGGRAGVIQ